MIKVVIFQWWNGMKVLKRFIFFFSLWLGYVYSHLINFKKQMVEELNNFKRPVFNCTIEEVVRSLDMLE